MLTNHKSKLILSKSHAKQTEADLQGNSVAEHFANTSVKLQQASY